MNKTYNYLEDESLLDNFTDDDASIILEWLERIAKYYPEYLLETISFIRHLNQKQAQKENQDAQDEN